MKNNINMKEKISALADGELSDFETRRLLEEISSNPEFREFWANIQLSKSVFSESDSSFMNIDLTKKISRQIENVIPEPVEEVTHESFFQLRYFAASIIGFCAVIAYAFFPQTQETFTDLASQKIVSAIDSPEAMEVLNGSVTGLEVELQDFKSDLKGTLANYRLPNSGETFRVSLYPIKEINKIGISEASKITYIKARDGIYVISVSGNLSADKKNQVLKQANFFADKLK
tara:strand:- start:801 stop:1493 length:693 start_codon:yes stop_codon:yes gene_type:complete